MKDFNFELIEKRVESVGGNLANVFIEAGINPALIFTWRRKMPIGLTWRYNMIADLTERFNYDIIEFEGTFHERVKKLAEGFNVSVSFLYAGICTDIRAAKRGEIKDVPQTAKFLKLLQIVRKLEKDKTYNDQLNEPYH